VRAIVRSPDFIETLGDVTTQTGNFHLDSRWSYSAALQECLQEMALVGHPHDFCRRQSAAEVEKQSRGATRTGVE